MNNNKPISKKFYSHIQSIIEASKNAVSRVVNNTIVRAYWEIGRLIFEEEQKGKNRANYGEFIIDDLSKKLSQEYGKGFSATNLRKMRQFFELFPIQQTVSVELSWSHYCYFTQVKQKEHDKAFHRHVKKYEAIL